jgi:hypothetical protein
LGNFFHIFWKKANKFVIFLWTPSHFYDSIESWMRQQLPDQQHAVFDLALGEGTVPVKDIYLYPLTKGFREALSQRVNSKEGRKMGGDR